MAMEPALTANLTMLQKAFVSAVVSGIDPETAAIDSGYSPESARRIAYEMLHQPHILGAVQIGVAKQLATAAPMALHLLKRIMNDERSDARLRVVCAKTLLDRAGHIAPKASSPGAAGETPLNEMSMTDLRALADKLSNEISGRAKVVSSAKPAPMKAQTVEDLM